MGSGIATAAARLLAGDVENAREICSGILAKNPRAPETLHVLGLTFAKAGDFENAAARLEEAIAGKPDTGKWYCDLGTAHAARGQWALAVSAFRQAHELIPRDTQNLYSYARALHSSGRFKDAGVIVRELLDLDPDCGKGRLLLKDCLNRIAGACWESGDMPGFLEANHQMSVSGFWDAGIESFHLNGLLHDCSHTSETILEAHRAWAERYCPGARPHDPPFLNSRSLDRPLRVGYVTGEFICVPGYHFILPLLRAHDRNSVEVFCYASADRVDRCAHSIQKLGHHWHDVHKLDDDALRDLIRDHRIDVLVEFSGHFDGHRLTAFAGRLAPVQIFYPNYPATSGIPSMDYVLTDQWLCPPGYEMNYSETVYRIPSGCIVYAPPGHVDMTPLPAISNGFVTFGLFQRPAKISSVSWDAIGEVLRATPGSRLLIQYDSALRPKFTAELEARGVSGSRLDVRDWLSIQDRVRLLGQVDIALDTFPYNGQTTTCECLWMGVPVVTRRGESHVSRVAASILHQVGLTEWIAESKEEYVAVATRFAGDLGELAQLRAGLRDRVAASPLVDASAKAREFEQAYREVWRKWVQAVPSPKLPTLNAA